MTHMEAMAAIAQGVINITEAERLGTDWKPQDKEDRQPLDVVQKGSRVFRGMHAIVDEERFVIERLTEARDLLAHRKPTADAIRRAFAILETMVKERTDPEFGT